MAKKRKIKEEPNSNSSDTDPEVNESESDTNDSDESEDISKILEPFNKEQLIELLCTAASNDPKLVKEIHRVADSDPAHRKLFVHGLGWETTSEKLGEFFSQYGEIEDCNVVTDKITGKSKGYGFLCFKHRKSAKKALKEAQKKIESRMTACQLASSGPGSASQSNIQPQQQQLSNSGWQDTLLRKIYVGNVHSDISSDRLHAFFSKYGEIEEGPLGLDKQTGKPKGYALFIYKTVEGARKALEEPSKSFEGHQLYCQKATDSHKLKAAAATANVPSSEFNVRPNGGGGVPYNAPNGALASNPSLYGQGVMGGSQQFGQGVAPIQAALAVLAAAGQNPAAFGVSPAVIASLNPAMATAMNAGQPGVALSAMPGYQNPQTYQPNNSYPTGPPGQGSVPRLHSAMGPMRGYMGR